jgi:hypothetical protein
LVCLIVVKKIEVQIRGETCTKYLTPFERKIIAIEVLATLAALLNPKLDLQIHTEVAELDQCLGTYQTPDGHVVE